MLQAQQQAAMAAGRTRKLRMQVRSSNAERATWSRRAWARRQLQVVVRPDVDATVMALRDFLVPTSQNAKSGRARFE